jgi:hypothetical protein
MANTNTINPAIKINVLTTIMRSHFKFSTFNLRLKLKNYDDLNVRLISVNCMSKMKNKVSDYYGSLSST